MRKHEQFEILVNHLAENTTLFISYLKTVLENRDNRFWDLEEDDEIKAFNISYAHEDLILYGCLWDSNMDECEEKEEISFFHELYMERNHLTESEDFLPKELKGIELDLDIYDRFEEWIFYCWKAARPSDFHLPAFLNEDDSAYYKNLDNGEKGDHIYVMDIIDPEGEEEE